MKRIAFALVVAVGGTADADGVKLTVAVGETVEREVGFAHGVMCDDTEIVRADMRTKNEQTNVFVLTGLKEGRTQCRAGTDPTRPYVVFDITVTPAKNHR
jgi:hypothetical protein